VTGGRCEECGGVHATLAWKCDRPGCTGKLFRITWHGGVVYAQCAECLATQPLHLPEVVE
jgi:hypothetical protein